jgi:hypothetical protein
MSVLFHGKASNRNITNECDQCIARKVPELCKAYTPGKSDHDFNARITRLEQIIEAALPQYCSPGTPTSSFVDVQGGSRPRSASMFAEDDYRSQIEEQDPSGGTFHSGKWYGNSASGSIAPDTVIAQVSLLRS